MSGKNGRGSCAICRRADVAAIDAALLLGKPLRSICQEFPGLSRSALHRHFQKHCRGAAEVAVTRANTSYCRHLQACMGRARDEVLGILMAARREGNSDLALRAAEELRQIVGEMRKLIVKTSASKPNNKPAVDVPEIQIQYEEAMEHVAQAQ